MLLSDTQRSTQLQTPSAALPIGARRTALYVPPGQAARKGAGGGAPAARWRGGRGCLSFGTRGFDTDARREKSLIR